MLGMPLTGWAMVSTSAREIPFFMFHWPHLPFVPISATMENPVHEFFEFFHKMGAKILIYGMIPLHVAAALKHQFVDKDEVFQHMVPGLKPQPVVNWRWIVPVGVVVLAVGFGEFIFRSPSSGADFTPAAPVSAEAPSADASDMSASTIASALTSTSASASSSASSSVAAITQWTVDKAASKIAWSTTFQGEAISGGFAGYAAQIAFDPDMLDKSHVKVSIDLASVASGDNDRDGTLKSDQFFNVSSFPKAVYEASKFTRTDAAHFVAHGKLSLHGVSKPLDLPFSLTIKAGTADMAATADLDRTAFSVGSGDYAKTDAIPAVVKLAITVKAHSSSKATK
jgi:polyisoprenoid-binding protein YceI